ncbi:MAG TPA: tetraacyldisaccharide 4'-kinase [Candidatus Binataceae bacterium]|nr:tetraacyldisaccharide 4'-kinase [Candidatus Binataceae bacterium]
MRAASRLRGRAERLWQNRLAWYQWPLWAPLVPASVLYSVAIACRSAYWRIASQPAGVRTIGVGNLTVGGNGKTPFTLFLASRLAARGLKTAIVSRGYAAQNRASGARLVADGRQILLGPDEAGDEPVMMAKSFGGPIAIARRRIDAINLLAQRGPLDIVVLDDAFQHLRLRRNVDLLLISAERGLGNGWMLPAGPMRERLAAAARASAIVLMLTEDGTVGPGVAEIADGERQRLIPAMLRPLALVRPTADGWLELPLELAGRRVLAVAGLADPRAFLRMLARLGAEITGRLEYRDHHRYTGSDYRAISEAARAANAIIVTTEKDLVKLERFPFAPDSLYALRLEVAMDEVDQARLLAMASGVDSVVTGVARA